MEDAMSKVVESPEVAKLGSMIIREDDLRIPAEVNGVDYEMRYPSPDQKAFIEVAIARRFDGMARESFPIGYQQEVIVRTTVENVLVRENSPKGFEPWECWDFDVVLQLYNAYVEFHRGFSKRIQDGRTST